MTTNQDTAVLIVGGGVAGLSAALFLAYRGVPTTLVERHAGSLPHPRAAGFTPRTIELLRTVGLDEQIPQLPLSSTVFARGGRPRRARVESLAGRWFEEVGEAPKNASPGTQPIFDFSPVGPAGLSQDGLEPLLRAKAAELGAKFRMGTELLRFEQDADGVTAHLRERSGKEFTLRAAYLVAADGNKSSIREALGIGRQGRGFIRTVRSVLFRAPLDAYLEKGVVQFNIEQPDFKAFLTTYRDGRWLLIFSDDGERDEATQLALVRKAIGRDDVPVELVTTGIWDVTAFIADRFSSGRVFLIGDAAHTLPPARGGYGANTGIADAHNLAWKLQAVLAGVSTSKLLDTYDVERRPIAWQRHDQIFSGEDYKAEAAGLVKQVPLFDPYAMEFGQLYRSSAVMGAGPELPDAKRPDEWHGQPGTRAPHLWVERAGKRVSTLDLLQRSWVLLTEDARWKAAAADVSQLLGIEVDCVVVGHDVRATEPATFGAAYGLRAGGGSLIRPDGYVAWRTEDLPPAPTEALREALRELSSAQG